MARNHLIDVLRGFAAFAVTIFHFNEVPTIYIPFYTECVWFGWLGVPVFFVLSGYYIASTYQRDPCTARFIIRRLFRIFPPYWFSLLVVLSVATIRKLTTGTNDVVEFPTEPDLILANIFLYLKPFSNVSALSWVYWTLVYEIIFYFIYAFAFLRASMGKIVLIFITCVSVFYAGEHQHITFFLNQWPLFAAGCAMFYIHNKEFPVGLGLLCLSGMAAIGQMDELPAVTGLITCGFIYLSHSKSLLKFNHDSPLSRLGEASYSLYLIHVPVGCYLLLRDREILAGGSYFVHIAYDFILAALLSIVSYCIFRFIELPSIRIGKLISNRLAKA